MRDVRSPKPLDAGVGQLPHPPRGVRPQAARLAQIRARLVEASLPARFTARQGLAVELAEQARHLREDGERSRLKALVNGERVVAVEAPQMPVRVLGCAAYELPILRALRERAGLDLPTPRGASP